MKNIKDADLVDLMKIISESKKKFPKLLEFMDLEENMEPIIDVLKRKGVSEHKQLLQDLIENPKISVLMKYLQKKYDEPKNDYLIQKLLGRDKDFPSIF